MCSWQRDWKSTMSGSNAKAIEPLDQTILDGREGTPAVFDEWREASRAALRVSLGEGDAMLERVDNVGYTPGTWSLEAQDSAFADVQRRGVQKGIALLRSARAIVEAESFQSHSRDVSALPSSPHPWVLAASAAFWNQRVFRTAVEEAARAIEMQMKAKLNVRDGTGVVLVTDDFSAKDRAIGKSRLRFAEFQQGTAGWTNAHEGAMSFGRGCMVRIRNLYTHGHEPDEVEAFEAVVALSLLARWVDSANVHIVAVSS